MAVHPTNKTAFVAGTEEGHIFFGNTVYNSRIMKRFTGHHMAVYGLSWNHFSKHIFVSGGADWTVRLWDTNKEYEHLLSLI